MRRTGLCTSRKSASSMAMLRAGDAGPLMRRRQGDMTSAYFEKLGLLEKVLKVFLRLVDDRILFFGLRRQRGDTHNERHRDFPRFLVLGRIVVGALGTGPAKAGGDEPRLAVVSRLLHPLLE